MELSRSTSVQIDRDRIEPPGIDGCLHFVDIRSDDTRPDEQRLADRTQRTFHVRAVLSKAHSQLESIRAVITPGEGGCFITTPHDLHIQDPHGSYVISRNALGELALVAGSIAAKWYEEAFEIFLSGLTPSLDHLSFISNTPIVVDIMEDRDQANHITSVTFRTPHATGVLSEGLLETYPPLFPAYGLYREALNANSNFYRFLCFYRILEGVFGQISCQLFRLARDQKISITKRQDLVSDDPKLREFQPTYIGRRIHDLYKWEFQAQYRHSVAHFALTDGSMTNPSSHRESSRFARIVYLLQVCAREVIRNREGYFAQFVRSGGRLI